MSRAKGKEFHLKSDSWWKNLSENLNDDILNLQINTKKKQQNTTYTFSECKTPHLGQLGLQVLHLSLQATLLAQRGAEAGVLGVEQSLLVPQPDQSRLQLRLLLSVPAGKRSEGCFSHFFLASFKNWFQHEKTWLPSSVLLDGKCGNTSWW